VVEVKGKKKSCEREKKASSLSASDQGKKCVPEKLGKARKKSWHRKALQRNA